MRRICVYVVVTILIVNAVVENIHEIIPYKGVTVPTPILTATPIVFECLSMNKTEFSHISGNQPLLSDIFASDMTLTVIWNLVGSSYGDFAKSKWHIKIGEQIISAFVVIKCGDGHTLIVKFKRPYEVDHVSIYGSLNNVKFDYVNVPFCVIPHFHKYLVACTHVRLDAMRTDRMSALRLIKEWVDYHVIQGVEHFTIYCNDDLETISQFFHNYHNMITFFDWQWPVFSAFNIDIGRHHQTSQQVSCIHRYRGRAQWVILTDVDEFLQPLVHNTIVRDLLQPYHSNEIGAISVVSHLFQKTQPNTSTISLTNRILQTFQPVDSLIAYVLHIAEKDRNIHASINTNSSLVTQSWFFESPHRGRHKCIVIPENVDAFSVHGVTAGKKTVRFNDQNTMRLNHYRYDCDFCEGAFRFDTSMTAYGPILINK